MRCAVIGASDKPHRYSYQAVMLLQEKGHEVFPVHHRIKSIESLKVYSNINEISEEIDTVTLYVGKAISDLIADDIIKKKPKRIIFNPGAENADLEMNANKHDIETINACTLVMLRTGQF